MSNDLVGMRTGKPSLVLMGDCHGQHLVGRRLMYPVTITVIARHAKASEEIFSPVHGGDIARASVCFGVPEDQWIDLSTGINPDAYPVGSVSTQAFQRLPYPSRRFMDAASRYYGQENFIATNGTQPVIERLPAFLAPLPALLPDIGYTEHRKAWTASGSRVVTYPALKRSDAEAFIEQALRQSSARHVVIINPNNPTGVRFPPALLLAWAKQLTAGGKLIIDEAFIDGLPGYSVLGRYFHENMVVLRSFGKFFGLAGLRLGCCFAEPEFLAELQGAFGMWEVNGPAQEIATRAFQDRQWIARTIARSAEAIRDRQAVLDPVFAPANAQSQTHQPFFSTYLLARSEAQAIYQYFGQQGILLRYLPYTRSQSLLRVGHFNAQDTHIIQRIHQAGNGFLKLSVGHSG